MRFRFWLIAAVVVILDQCAKVVVQTMLPLYGPSVTVIPGVLWLTHVHNTGVAFGQLHNAGPILILMAAAAAIFIIGYRARLMRAGSLRLHPVLTFGLALPLGGAIGNMLDRIRIGHVVDFIDLGWFPVFNVADSAITVGAVLLAAYFLLIQRSDEAPAAAPRLTPQEASNERGA